MSSPSNQDLKDLIRFENESGMIWLGQQRMLLQHASTFGDLRRELINAFGEDYARGVLMRMGHTSGLSDAKLARELRADRSVMDMFMVGPQLHMLEGIVSVEPVKVELDISKGQFYGEFIWINSFEAAEHLRLFGVSEHAVCWHLLGYATGYTSALMGVPIFYKEIECIGKGDKQCRIIGKPLAEWEDADELEKMLSLESLANKLQILEEEVEDLRIKEKEFARPQSIVADSAAIKEVMFLLEKAAKTNVTVLMLGETGVGKEVFSNSLHQMGPRKDRPFVAINCAALPRDLVESELFGVEKGGYTSADKSRAGRFERADGGTLFLDELGELDRQAQAKLLRVIQTGEVERVGGNKVIKVDVRLIAATNADLIARVKEGTFRADLYYRLNVFPINIPPLRERYSDIPGLLNKFVNKYNKKHGKNVLGVSDETLQRFKTYDWPGNIRELENLIERGVILTDSNTYIDSSHICIGMPASSDNFMTISHEGKLETCQPVADQALSGDLFSRFVDEQFSLEELEVEFLKTALARENNNVTQAAKLLGLSVPQCRYRLKKHGLSAD
jgi:transcriptional regulator with PAS, ATPase and Fis domain